MAKNDPKQPVVLFTNKEEYEAE